MSRIRLSKHAQQRLDQRTVNYSDIEAAFAWGDRISAGDGITCYAITRRVIRILPELAPSEGTAVLAERDGTVLTVYRNHNFRPREIWKRQGLDGGSIRMAESTRQMLMEVA